MAYTHPALMPEALANDLIITYSKKDDVVLDVFSGAGTTLKMAKINNRKYIGIEISDEYCNLASERLKMNGQEMLF